MDLLTKSIQVRNNKRSEMARKTIENLAAARVMHNDNSINTGGISAIIYVPLISGRVCSCGQHTSDVLDTSGNMSISTMDSILSGDVSIDNYSANSDIGDFSIGIEEYSSSGSSVDTSSEKINDLVNVTPEALDELNQLMVKSTRIGGAKRSSCAICMGNTFVGGYYPLKGSRIILDATVDYQSTSILDTDTAPYSFKMYSGSTITWPNLVIPKGASSIDSLVIRDNKDIIASGCVLEYSLDNINFSTLTLESFSNIAIGTAITVRLVSSTNVRVTHIEIQVSYASLLKIDVSSATQELKINYFNFAGDIQITLPVSSAQDLHGSIISSQFGIWRVTSVTIPVDHSNNVQSTEVSARKVEVHEVVTELPLTLQIRYLTRKTTQPNTSRSNNTFI